MIKITWSEHGELFRKYPELANLPFKCGNCNFIDIFKNAMIKKDKYPFMWDEDIKPCNHPTHKQPKWLPIKTIQFITIGSSMSFSGVWNLKCPKCESSFLFVHPDYEDEFNAIIVSKSL